LRDARVGSAQRDGNRRRVVNALRVAGPSTRADLLKAGLSRSTVANVVDDLISAGLVVRVQAALEPRVNGRPPEYVGLDGGAATAAGVEIANGCVRLALCNVAQELIAFDAADVPEDSDPENTLRVVRDLIKSLSDRTGVPLERLIGVGVAVPGPVQRRTGIIGRACTLAPWIGVRSCELAEEVLGSPALVANDANLAALAETTWGAGRGYDDVAYVYTAYGIGVGLVLGGQLYSGAAGTAGEIGHTTVDEHGEICACGGRGCLNTVADPNAVTRQLQQVLSPGITIREVIELTREGDPRCRRVMADAGRQIGAALASLYNLLDPEVIIIGGYLKEAGPALLDPLRESMARCAIHAGEAISPVITGRLDDEVVAMGAAAGVLRDPLRFPLPMGDGA
jgi:predicted NBD/HSP70 family sugar kinase